uniref:Transposase n=1 Tax=Peronospora matthiolae TaxID=2874970 RepID=A0AAV1UM57_9STRA
MYQLLATYKTTITASQEMKLFMRKKDSKRTWAEHYLYMVAISDVRAGDYSLILDNILHHASPEMMNVMRSKYDPTFRLLTTCIRDGAFYQSNEVGSRAIGSEVIAAQNVDRKRRDTHTCYMRQSESRARLLLVEG